MKYYLGIDLGGTFIKGGVVDENGKIIAKDKVPTEKEKGAEGVMDNVALLVDKLLAAANLKKSDIGGVGMGVPGMINGKDGIVVTSNNLNWLHVEMVKGMKDRTGLDFTITNDANAAALGEATYGVGRDYDDSILLTLGTGVGGGIVLSNRIVEGNKSAGAELGHMVICDGGEQCTCGRKGCFEAYCSATALIRDTKRAMLAHKDSKMWEIAGDIANVDGKTAFDGWRAGDAAAAGVVDMYIEYRGCGLTNIVNTFQPEVLLIGGGICKEGENLTKPLYEIIKRDSYCVDEKQSTKLDICKLGNDAGIIGAAFLYSI